MPNYLTDHHELCDGSECSTWDCATLPANVAQYREGEIIAVRDGGREVDIKWSDDTVSTLRKPKPPARDAWVESVRKHGKCRDSMCACQTLEL